LAECGKLNTMEAKLAHLEARVDGHDEDIKRLIANDDRLFDRLDRQYQWTLGLLVAILIAVISTLVGVLL
jgi:hypothetical protein